MTTTHLAGPVIHFQGRVIQRCAVCGEKLEDYHLNRIAVISTCGNTEPPHFAEAHCIQVSEGNPKRFLDLGAFTEIETIPDDFCISLVEE
jgi:hypothetical protein